MLRNANELVPGVRLVELTDEEWEQKDAAVKAQVEAEAAARRDRERTAYREALLEQGLSAHHVDVIWAGLLQTPAVQAMTTVTARGTWALMGGVGCGKTTAAHVWLLRGDPAAHKVAFLVAQTFARTSRYEGKIEQFSDPVRLVIDDLGVEYLDAKGSALCDFDELLDTRARAGLATLLTTNLPAAAFKRRYGDRIADRIREGGGWLNVDGPSLRGARP